MRVVLSVYDVNRACNAKAGDMLGWGIYHTGVEINGVEYQFGGNTQSRNSGVYTTYPRQNPNFNFKRSVDLGEIPNRAFRANEAKLKGSRAHPDQFSNAPVSFSADIAPVLQELMNEFRAYQYHLL